MRTNLNISRVHDRYCNTSLERYLSTVHTAVHNLTRLTCYVYGTTSRGVHSCTQLYCSIHTEVRYDSTIVLRVPHLGTRYSELWIPMRHHAGSYYVYTSLVPLRHACEAHIRILGMILGCIFDILKKIRI